MNFRAFLFAAALSILGVSGASAFSVGSLPSMQARLAVQQIVAAELDPIVDSVVEAKCPTPLKGAARSLWLAHSACLKGLLKPTTVADDLHSEAKRLRAQADADDKVAEELKAAQALAEARLPGMAVEEQTKQKVISEMELLQRVSPLEARAKAVEVAKAELAALKAEIDNLQGILARRILPTGGLREQADLLDKAAKVFE